MEKDHARVEAYGTVDELNSTLGMLLSYPLPDNIRACLFDIQHDLFDLGGELCIPGHRVITADATQRLETQLDDFNAHLPPLKEFILPGGSPAASACHIARTVCRRAERRVITLVHSEHVNSSESVNSSENVNNGESVNHNVLTYLNRLSDLLFVIARVLARHEGGQEVLWKRHL